MGQYYRVEKVFDQEGVTELILAFGTPAQNPEIVRDAVSELRKLELKGGRLLKLNGPSTLPVAMALACEVAHLYQAIAMFDPKLKPGYVVCLTRDPQYELGQQLA